MVRSSVPDSVAILGETFDHMRLHVSPSHLWGIAGMLLSGLVAAGDPAAPTALDRWDAVLCGLFVSSMTLALSFAHRWPITMLTLALAAGLGSSVLWSAICLAGLMAAIGGLGLNISWWPLRVATGAVAANGLLHLRELGDFGGSALFAAVAAAVALVSVWFGLEGAARRWLKWGLVLALFVVALPTGGGVFAVWRAAPDIADGSDWARDGLEAARDGEIDRASSQLGRSSFTLASADEELHSWYAKPARGVPIVGQHLAVARVATANAGSVAGAAQAALVDADVDRLRVSGGRIDVGLIAEMAGPLGEARDSLAVALAELERSRSPWLLPVVHDRLDDVSAELAEALPDATKAADATRLLPDLLGRDGPKRYLVLFATPAESRELGGIVGNVVELTVDSGNVTITDQKRDAELNAAAPGEFADPSAYPARFTINRPDLFSQNWSGMTDLPTVAQAVAELYPSMGGKPIDGVLYADPYGIAALMEFTGPVEVPELGRSLDSESVVPFLLVEQYEIFEQEARVSFLDRIAVTTFDRLLAAELPSPRRVGEVLGPAARQGRLQMATFDDEQNAFLETMFLLGDLPEADGHDHLAVVHANGGGDKLDGFLQRDVTYRAVIDEKSGRLAATVTVELTNNVPTGLPGYVIGRAGRDVPPGTNNVHLSIYTTHELRQLRVDGAAVDAELQRELGYQRYLTFAEVAPGETVTVEYDLEGGVDLSGGFYRLTVAPQAVANPDTLELDVRIDDRELGPVLEGGLIVEDTIFELDLG